MGINLRTTLILRYVNGTIAAVKSHWPEYLIEALGLGTFMVSACVFGVLIFHPDSYFAGYAITSRNVLMGIAIGATAISIFKSAWGKRSGAHINPAVTLTFFRLGRISGVDAVWYSTAHFIGAVVGVSFAWVVLGGTVAVPEVNFVATVPGVYGLAAAFAGEFVIAFLMMTMVLNTANHRTLHRYTPYLAGLFVAVYIALESPISGMSMNPARTFGSAILADTWTAWWIYFIAPPAAMLAAAEMFVRTRGLKAALCAKLDHTGTARCIFNCRFDEMHEEKSEAAGTIEITKEAHQFRTIAGLF